MNHIYLMLIKGPAYRKKNCSLKKKKFGQNPMINFKKITYRSFKYILTLVTTNSNVLQS